MSEWISVNDRLPNEPKTSFSTSYVDVFINSGKLNMYREPDCIFEKGMFWQMILDGDGDFSYSEEITDVTHWMPLPEPPK